MGLNQACLVDQSVYLQPLPILHHDEGQMLSLRLQLLNPVSTSNKDALKAAGL